MSAEMITTLVNRSVLTQMVPTPVSVELVLSLGRITDHVKVCEAAMYNNVLLVYKYH